MKWTWPRVRQIATVPAKNNGGTPPGRGRGGNGGKGGGGTKIRNLVGIGTEAGAADDADGTTLSWAHTCTGNDRLLIVHVTFDRASGGTPTVSGVTYNGVAMTVLVADSGSQNARMSCWYLVAPANGANTVQVTWSGSGATKRKARSRNFDNVDQVLPVGTPVTTTGGDSSPTATVNDAAGTVIDCLTVHGGGVSQRTFSVNCSQTQQYNTTAPTGGTGHGGGYKRASGTATMCWAINTGAEWRLMALAVNGT